MLGSNHWLLGQLRLDKELSIGRSVPIKKGLHIEALNNEKNILMQLLRGGATITTSKYLGTIYRIKRVGLTAELAGYFYFVLFL